MSDRDNDLLALEALRDKLTTPENVWLNQMRARWDDPTGRAITSREWQRIRELTEEASQR